MQEWPSRPFRSVADMSTVVVTVSKKRVCCEGARKSNQSLKKRADWSANGWTPLFRSSVTRTRGLSGKGEARSHVRRRRRRGSPLAEWPTGLLFPHSHTSLSRLRFRCAGPALSLSFSFSLPYSSPDPSSTPLLTAADDLCNPRSTAVSTNKVFPLWVSLSVYEASTSVRFHGDNSHPDIEGTLTRTEWVKCLSVGWETVHFSVRNLLNLYGHLQPHSAQL